MTRNAEYVAKFRTKRRAMIKDYLGGKCAKCGNSENLDVDHIDPETKSFTIGNNLQIKWESMEKELDKCQLLCRPCHLTKTKLEQTGREAWNKGKWNHGSITGYQKGCRCDECKKVQSSYKRKLKARKVAGEANRDTLLTCRAVRGSVGSNPTPSATEGPTLESQAASKAVGCKSLMGSSPIPSSKELI